MTKEEMHDEANKTPLPTFLKRYAIQKEKGEPTATTICNAMTEYAQKEHLRKLEEAGKELDVHWDKFDKEVYYADHVKELLASKQSQLEEKDKQIVFLKELLEKSAINTLENDIENLKSKTK